MPPELAQKFIPILKPILPEGETITEESKMFPIPSRKIQRNYIFQ